VFWTEEKIQKVREAMRIRAARPWEVRRQEWIDWGIIDKDGNPLPKKRPEWGGQMYPGQPRPVRRDDPTEVNGPA